MTRPPFLLVLGTLLASLAVGGCREAPSAAPTWTQEDGHRWADLRSPDGEEPGFELRPSSETAIRFENRLTDAEIDSNQHYMNGSGVAAGDVTGNGWPDLYFARLNGPNRLYENQGGFRFRNVTDSAGVAHPNHYSTSATFADMDGDGDLDLLVGTMHEGVTGYLNDGDGHFSRWSRPPLESGKGTTTLALADVDGDGDLDLYVTNYKERSAEDIYARHEIATENIVRRDQTDGRVRAEIRPPFDEHFALVGTGDVRGPAETGEVDALYLNDGDGHFQAVDSLETRFRDPRGRPLGLEPEWGLNASFRDFNGDGRPDLYVNNDFWTPDRIWINQGGGVFRAIDSLAMRNQSFSSMTVDFSDVNRDGALDLFVTEMLSPEHSRRLRQYTPKGPASTDAITTRPQYNRNSLYLNRGDDTYAEIAYSADVEATGWSWATRFLDVDLDGYEDLLVNTGFPHDVQDMDSRREMGRRMQRRPEKRFITEYPSLSLPNVAFRNNGDRTFSRMGKDWGFSTQDEVSHGLATADFDRDGDLDLAVNRLNEEAALYESRAPAPRIAVQLSAPPPNTQGIGATITLEGGPGAGAPQRRELTAGGDYLSSSAPTVTFAAAPDSALHTLTVRWPGGTESVLDSVRAGRLYDVQHPSRSSGLTSDSTDVAPGPETVSPVFEEASDRLGHTHHENAFDDFQLQPLLPIRLSRLGPGTSWIDFDRDGDEDLFIASGEGGRMGIFENDGAGTFTERALGPLTDTAAVDQTTVLGWPTEAGTHLVVGTSNYESRQSKRPSARHYLWSDGEIVSSQSLPGDWSATGPMAAADYDGDGDLDLFVGGRVIRAQYPWDASSRLFENRDGEFVLDESNADLLSGIGLVTGAVFTDYDGDGDTDLLLSRAWDSLKLFRNDDGTFRDITEAVGLDQYTGWWNGIATGDFTGNGRPDLIATNWGTNSPYQLDTERPLRLYYADFNRDRRGEIIEAYYDPDAGGYVPRRKRGAFRSTPVPLSTQAETYRQFARSTIPELLNVGENRRPSVKSINTLRHTLFRNEGDTLVAQPLPPEAQYTAAFHAEVADFDADGREDLFLSQNLFSVRPKLPRLDGGRGLWLDGDGTGHFEPVPGHVSGVRAYGEQRGAALADVNDDGRVDLVLSQNDASTTLYLNRSEGQGLRVRLTGPPGNRAGVGGSVRLLYENGTAGPRREVQVGGGHWSQGSTEQVLGRSGPVASIEVRWPTGRVDTMAVSEEPPTVLRYSSDR